MATRTFRFANQVENGSTPVFGTWFRLASSLSHCVLRHVRLGLSPKPLVATPFPWRVCDFLLSGR